MRNTVFICIICGYLFVTENALPLYQVYLGPSTHVHTAAVPFGSRYVEVEKSSNFFHGDEAIIIEVDGLESSIDQLGSAILRELMVQASGHKLGIPELDL